MNAIIQRFPTLDWIWDKPLYVDFSGGCCASKRRIDLRALVEHPHRGLFWLCVEIDEHQHRGYEDGYEIVRYNDLFVDFSGKYVFLRINPDPFRSQERGGERIDPPFEDRLAMVEREIQDILMDGGDLSPPLAQQSCAHGGPKAARGGGGEDLVEVRHLFYDTIVPKGLAH